MENIFGEELTKIRESCYPGLSLRRVGIILHEEHGFGEYFYTQLSKMEKGTIIPSADLVHKILDAYGYPKSQRLHIMDLLSVMSAHSRMHDMSPHGPSIERRAALLYRKVKRKK